MTPFASGKIVTDTTVSGNSQWPNGEVGRTGTESREPRQRAYPAWKAIGAGKGHMQSYFIAS